MTSDERTVSLKGAAEIAGVSTRTIREWMHRGKVRFERTVGGSPRIYPSSLFVKKELADSGETRKGG
jgi:excisionase family DNA binding protein